MVESIITYGWDTIAIPLPDGTTEWWKITDAWRKIRTDPPIGEITMDEELAAALAHIELLPGPKGDTGENGTPGAQGEQGLPGEDGAQGVQGEQGIPGSAGEQGIQGEPGAKGDKGDKGDTGDTGAPGSQGEPGVKGDTGDTGAQGIQGNPGIQGDPGVKGDTGAKGDTGEQGIQGIQGNPGTNGTNGTNGLNGFPNITIPLIAPTAFIAWTNMPAAVTEFLGLAIQRTKVDLTTATSSRVTVRIGVVPVANAKIKVQYSTDESAWTDLCSVTMPATANKTNIGAWTDVPAGAKADVFLRLVGIDGNGVADPSFGLISLQVK